MSLQQDYKEEYQTRIQEAERPDLYNIRLINEVEPPELQEVEVPKVLGDVFEALIGAVYIDSGHCLHTVKRAPLRGRHEGAAQEPQEDATRALPHCQVQPRRGNGHAEYMVIWEVFAVFRIPIPQWFESGSNSINLYPQ